MEFWSCSNPFCGRNFSVKNNHHENVCPNCSSPLDPGISFYEALYYNYDIVDSDLNIVLPIFSINLNDKLILT